MTGPSTVTNLNVANSFVVFAPPSAGGGFKTLTVTNYSGSGANITMNVALGGASQAADQIVVNGGRATGSTLLTVKNVGGSGGQTSGRRHSSHDRDQRRQDRLERLRARQHAGRRRLPIHAR